MNICGHRKFSEVVQPDRLEKRQNFASKARRAQCDQQYERF
jgi:hypothetical protein